MSESTKFSRLFMILFSHSSEKRRRAFFLSLLDWVPYANKLPESISFWTNGKRNLPDSYIQELKNPNAIANTLTHLEKAMTKNITNMDDLMKELSEYTETLSITSDTKARLRDIQEDRISELISYLLYLSIVDTDHLPAEPDSESDSLHRAIWRSSKNHYFNSRRKGNRFSALNILQELLPKGYVLHTVLNFHFDSINTKLTSIKDICEEKKSNIAITGEGGIGKTTFLQKILEEEFGSLDSPIEYNPKRIIPIFIELNRCPKEISSWYDDYYKKTNFITRQIADTIQSTIENINDKYPDYNTLLNEIEKEFRKISEDGHKEYLLLLDGFNEVSTATNSNGKTPRASLSHEISELSKLANVRIITTSRPTHYAYYANNFTRVHLSGLEDDDISSFLSECGFSDALVGQILSNKQLKKCLSVPLFLIMFSIKKEYDSQVPETYGEILSNFFHKNGNYYNIRKRSQEAYNNPFENDPYVLEMLLDFIVPYIGWYYVQNDTFSLSQTELTECIKSAISETQRILSFTKNIPLLDFDSQIENARGSLSILWTCFKNDPKPIIACIVDYLSIIYQFQTKSNTFSDTYRFSFIHHYFRDYFSATWIINNLRLLPTTKESIPFSQLHESITSKYWCNNEAEVIGQILQEHRNKPWYDKKSGNWRFPIPSSFDQRLLTSVLDWVRTGKNNSSEGSVLLQNIISTFHICRGELSGVCFDSLDLRKCSFHNITCSRKGKTNTLAATFRKAIVSETTFTPRGHFDSVMEYLYSGHVCITIDTSMHINVWDILSGSLVQEFDNEDANAFCDFSSKGFIRVSPDESLLAVRMLAIESQEYNAYIKVFSLKDPSFAAKKTQIIHGQIRDFIFTKDSKHIVIIDDSDSLYTYNIVNNQSKSIVSPPILRTQLSGLFSSTRMFLGQGEDVFYIHTCDVNTFDWDSSYSESADSLDEYDDEDADENKTREGVKCKIFKGSISSGEITLLHTYESEPETFPAYEYIPGIDSFMIFDYNLTSLMLYDCKLNDASVLLESIIEDNDNYMPDTIHSYSDTDGVCYVMYPNICYQIEICPSGCSYIIEKYEVPTLENKLSDQGSSELTFVVNTAPKANRFLLWNDDHDTFEWHVESGELQHKYNALFYDTVALLSDSRRDLFFLVHSENGVSIFSQKDYLLTHSICFPESDYIITHAKYSDSSGYLYLLFERGQHNFVRKINIDTSESFIVFSEMKPSDNPTQMALSDDGLHLLITTSMNCYEYSSISDTISTVYTAKDNELLTLAYYMGNEIHIGIAMAREYLKPIFDPRCEVFTRDDNKYCFQYGYKIPTLDPALFPFFTHENYDTGIPCCLQTNYIQRFWITKGFFSQSTQEIMDLLTVQKLKKESGDITESGQVRFDLFQTIQVIHTTPIANAPKTSIASNTYSYLSSDFSCMIGINDYELVTYWPDYKANQSLYKTFDYKNDKNLSKEDVTSWDFAAPSLKGHLICCSESFHLFVVNSETGNFETEIEYSPGLAICGCKFSGINASTDIRKMLIANGGIV